VNNYCNCWKKSSHYDTSKVYIYIYIYTCHPGAVELFINPLSFRVRSRADHPALFGMARSRWRIARSVATELGTLQGDHDLPATTYTESSLVRRWRATKMEANKRVVETDL